MLRGAGGSFEQSAGGRVCVVGKGGMQGLLSRRRDGQISTEGSIKWHVSLANVVSCRSFINGAMRSLDKKGNTILCL
jgi:hypothetical protein